MCAVVVFFSDTHSLWERKLSWKRKTNFLQFKSESYIIIIRFSFLLVRFSEFDPKKEILKYCHTKCRRWHRQQQQNKFYYHMVRLKWFFFFVLFFHQFKQLKFFFPFFYFVYYSIYTHTLKLIRYINSIQV